MNKVSAKAEMLAAARKGSVERMKRETVPRKCESCSADYMADPTELRRGKGLLCSLSCAAVKSAKSRDQVGPANNNWRGGSDNTDRKRRYRTKYPEKYAAHLAMTRAIRSGVLTKGACEKCGDLDVEGHHVDYARPLYVRWLCKKHHLMAHRGRFG